MRFVNNIKSVFAADTAVDKDRGDLVQTVLIVAGFAVVTIAAVGYIGTSLLNKGADVAACIENSSTFDSANGTATKCKEQKHTKNHSFTKDSEYTSRFGSSSG